MCTLLSYHFFNVFLTAWMVCHRSRFDYMRGLAQRGKFAISFDDLLFLLS